MLCVCLGDCSRSFWVDADAPIPANSITPILPSLHRFFLPLCYNILIFPTFELILILALSSSIYFCFDDVLFVVFAVSK